MRKEVSFPSLLSKLRGLIFSRESRECSSRPRGPNIPELRRNGTQRRVRQRDIQGIGKNRHPGLRTWSVLALLDLALSQVPVGVRLNSTLRLPEGAPRPGPDPAAPHPHPDVRLVGQCSARVTPPPPAPSSPHPAPTTVYARSSYLPPPSLVKFYSPQGSTLSLSLSNRADHLSKDGERVSRNFSAAEAPGSATASTRLARIPRRRSTLSGRTPSRGACPPATAKLASSPRRDARRYPGIEKEIETGWGSGDSGNGDDFGYTLTGACVHALHTERLYPEGAHFPRSEPCGCSECNPSPGRIHLGIDHPFA